MSRARRWRRKIWHEVATVAGLPKAHAAVADRARAPRDLCGDARPRMPSARAAQPRGAIFSSPAIGLIPDCRRRSKARCGPETARPISLRRRDRSSDPRGRVILEANVVPAGARPQHRGGNVGAPRLATARRPLGLRARSGRDDSGGIRAAAALSGRAVDARSKPRSPPICAASRAIMAAGRCSATAPST